jgi:hypothetical protein
MTMRRKETVFIAIVAALALFVSACIVAETSRRGGESYYYYPDNEIYFYPQVGWYYWFEGGDWRHGAQPPARFVLRDRDRVRFDWEREPHRDHDRIRRDYPPGRRDQDRDRDRDRDGGRDRDKDRR